MLRRVAVIIADVSEERIAYIIKATRIVERTLTVRLLVTAGIAASSPILVIPMMEAIYSFETPILTRVTRRNSPEDGVLHNHRSEDLGSYIALTG
jgi:hypothetical protein